MISSDPRHTPTSTEAEETVLSCCMIDAPTTLGLAVAAGLTPLSFSDPANGLVFERIMAMHAAGKPVDAATVAEELTASQQMGGIGGWAKFMAITSKAITTINAAYFVDRVKTCHTRREMLRLTGLLASQLQGPADEGEEITRSLARLNAIAGGAIGEKEPKWVETVAAAVAHAERIIAKTPDVEAMTLDWPWPVANKRFMPIRRGELVVLAARTSVGKSSLARAIALFHAKAARNVLFESLEDHPQSIAFQSAAAVSGIAFTSLADAHPADQGQYLAGLRSLAFPNLHVFSQDSSLAAIITRAKAIQAQTPLDFVIVDQLSHITDCTPRGSENKASSIGAVTKTLKKLAMDLHVPLLLLCQFSRAQANDSNREPKLSDLRDSGEIEQDADRVVFLHRPDTDPLTKQDQSKSEDADDRPQFFTNAIQAKGRGVGAGQIVSFYFRRRTASFIPATKVIP